MTQASSHILQRRDQRVRLGETEAGLAIAPPCLRKAPLGGQGSTLRHTGTFQEHEDQVFPCLRSGQSGAGTELRQARSRRGSWPGLSGALHPAVPPPPDCLFSQEHTLQGTLPYA